MNNSETGLMRKLFRTILPVQTLAMGLPSINTLLDSVIVGNYMGSEALAAIGFSGPFILAMVAVSGVFALGTQILCGRQLGKGDKTGIQSSFNTMLVMCAVVGLLFTAVCIFAPDTLALYLGATGTMTKATAEYLRGLGIGSIFTLITSCLLSLTQMERMKKITTVTMVIILVVNVGGNFLNVTKLGWGLYGAGFFQAMSNIAATGVISVYMVFRSELFKISVRSVRWTAAWEILRLGSPRAVFELCGIARSLAINYFVYMTGGTLGMAAIAVAGSISNASGEMLESGYSNAGSAIASVLVGNRDSSSLRDLSKVMVQSVWWLCLTIYLLIFLFASPLALLFGAEPAHIDTYIRVIRIYNLWILINLPGSAVRCIYQALGRVRLTNIMAVIGSAAFPILFLLLFARTGGLYLVCAVIPVIDAFSLFMYAVVFTLQAHRLPRSVFELAYIPDTVSAPRENRFKATVRTEADATEASVRIVSFCKEKGLPAKVCYWCGLCVEEIAVDAVSNRFAGKDFTMDLRAIYENGHLSLMFRDGCKRFDPMRWLNLCRPEDKSRSLGIRMVAKISDEMSYVNTMGLNVLNITVFEKAAVRNEAEMKS